MRQILRWTRHSLMVCAVSLLAYCGYVLIDARMFQQRAERQLEGLVVTASVGKSTAVLTKGLIGRIDIPRLGLSAIVMEGTSTTTLRRAVGHIAGTAQPGQRGNVAISGHRDTFFRPLRDINHDDIIMVTTTTGEYRYRVLSTRVVGPEDVAVLDPGENETLTLVTCYPFYFVGPAPKRFIVRAERVNTGVAGQKAYATVPPAS